MPRLTVCSSCRFSFLPIFPFSIIPCAENEFRGFDSILNLGRTRLQLVFYPRVPRTRTSGSYLSTGQDMSDQVNLVYKNLSLASLPCSVFFGTRRKSTWQVIFEVSKIILMCTCFGIDFWYVDTSDDVSLVEFLLTCYVWLYCLLNCLACFMFVFILCFIME